MSTDTTTDTAAMLREEVAAKAESLSDMFTAYDRDANAWTCPADGDDCPGFDDAECPGVDECPAAEELQDTYGGESPAEALDDYPLEVVFERGRPFTVVFSTGGPHVEISGDVAWRGDLALRGYWAGVNPVERRGGIITRAADYYLERVEELYGE